MHLACLAMASDGGCPFSGLEARPLAESRACERPVGSKDSIPGAALAPPPGMNLDRLLVRCRALEGRAAGVYRTFASRTRHDPELCAMWTALARDEETHAQAIARAGEWLDASQRWHTNLDGWDDELDEIEARLSYAERADIGADVERQLVAALALERTELDTLFHRLLALLPARERPHADEHTKALVAMAKRHSKSPAVAMEAALLQAHQLLRHAS